MMLFTVGGGWVSGSVNLTRVLAPFSSPVNTLGGERCILSTLASGLSPERTMMFDQIDRHRNMLHW